MTRFVALSFVCFALSPLAAAADTSCPWSGNSYAFADHGIYGDFVVDANCTQVTWDRLSDGPEVAPLERISGGWTGDLEKVRVKLLEDGEHVQLTAYGGISRRSRVDLK